MNNISPARPKSRSITFFRSAKVPGPFDALANSAKSNCPTPAFSAATTASKGLEDVRLNRSISTLRIDILPKCCARSATRNRLLVEGCVFEKVGERRRRKALDVPNSDIAQYVIERGRRLPADDAAQAIPELPLHCQPWKLGENRTRLLLRD